MKTAVSIPDGLFRQADELAGRLGKSRSQIYREALAEYVARREPGALVNEINQAIDSLGIEDAGIDPWLAEAGRRALERVE